MFRISVLLPQPLSPITTKISPRRTEKAIPLCTTRAPKPIASSRTSISGGSPPGPALAASSSASITGSARGAGP
jgi:hypothetical protein